MVTFFNMEKKMFDKSNPNIKVLMDETEMFCDEFHDLYTSCEIRASDCDTQLAVLVKMQELLGYIIDNYSSITTHQKLVRES